MINFLKWFYTDSNGMMYMTTEECIKDNWVAILTTILGYVVCLVYYFISNTNRRIAERYPNSITKTYHNQLYKVFFLCAITGYFIMATAYWIPLYKLRLLSLIWVIYESYKLYRFTVKTNAIQRMHQAEVALQEKLEKIRHTLSLFESKILDKFHNKEDVEMISFKDLSALTELEKYEKDGIMYMPVDLKQEIKKYRTTIDSNVYFGKAQEHDCWELCFVREGILERNKGRGKTYQVGEYMLIPPFEAHEPGNPDSETITDIDVYFSKEPFTEQFIKSLL